VSLKQMAYVWQLPVGATKPAGRLLLLALADIADDDGKCFPGRAYIARKCGLARNTVGIVMKRLTEAGYVIIEQRQRDDKTYSSNLYTLHVAPGACDDLPTPQHDLPRSHDGEPSYSSSIPQGDEKKNSTKEKAQEAFAHHCKVMASGRSQDRTWHLSDTLQDKIITRLNTFTVEELKQAASNLSTSSWHRGQNPQGKEYCSPQWLYRNDDVVDEWLNMEDVTPVSQQPSGPPPDSPRRVNAEYEVQVANMKSGLMLMSQGFYTTWQDSGIPEATLVRDRDMLKTQRDGYKK